MASHSAERCALSVVRMIVTGMGVFAFFFLVLQMSILAVLLAYTLSPYRECIAHTSPVLWSAHPAKRQLFGASVSLQSFDLLRCAFWVLFSFVGC